jgi:branched-chain amino acid transport system substrate-binding protein
MPLTRRQALATAGAALASSLAKPAIAAKEPISIGYLPALTGPSSSTGIGINRGVQFRRSTRPAVSTGGRSN